MKALKKLYRKVITTEPVVFLDIFKAIVILGTSIGFFTIDDAKFQTISIALGIALTAILTWLNRDVVYSEKTVENIKRTKRITTQSQYPLDKG